MRKKSKTKEEEAVSQAKCVRRGLSRPRTFAGESSTATGLAMVSLTPAKIVKVKARVVGPVYDPGNEKLEL